MRRSFRALTGALASCLSLTLTGAAQAQVPGQVPGPYANPPGSPSGPPGYVPSSGGAPYAPPGAGLGYAPAANPYPYAPPGPARVPDWELGLLYGSATAYGLGLGIGVDAELGLTDPALVLIPPVLLGGAGALGAYALEESGVEPGMPASLALGMLVGSGNGLGVTLNQTTRAEGDEAWGFRGFARSQALGAGLGAAAGWGYHELVRPTYAAQGLIASAALWGGLLGAEFGWGVSSGPWRQANDSLLLGSLVGFDAAALGAAAGVAALGWSPSPYQLGMMWAGFGVGTAASLPVYLFYLGSDHDPRRGLVFQSVAGSVGLGAGALLAARSEARAGTSAPAGRGASNLLAKVKGGGPMPLPGGLGLQVFGEL